MQNLAEYKQVEQTGSEYVLNVVLTFLKGIFPGWRGAIKTQADLDGIKKEWLTAFVENNIKTDTQIQRGLTQARKKTSAFLPSVGQFVEWCKSPHESHRLLTGIEYNEAKVSAERIAELKNMTNDELREVLNAKLY